MRVFMCTFTGFSLAIPMHSVSSVDLYTGEATSLEPFVHNQESHSTYVSLPRLFSLPLVKTRHCIVLKSNSTENKIILLVTEVECEAEIPDEEIYPLPKVFEGTLFSTLFSGIQLGANPCVLLSPERLVHGIIEKDFPI